MFTDKDAVIIGLTGMSGAGKTTACTVFSDFGFSIINCDMVSRIVVEKEKPALKELIVRFGESAVLSDGTLNRKYIGNLIFSDEKERYAFNEIIYPYISYEMIITAIKYIESGSRVIILDAPTLFESGTDCLCDYIVSVVSGIESCIERIRKRDNLTSEEAKNRLLSQNPPDFYRSKSDFCVENTGSVDEMKNQVRIIAEKIGDINAQEKEKI